MPVALVIIIAAAWVVILVPGIIRRRSTSGESDSISHFHRQLRILEHSAPRPIVAPAYRLHAPDGEPGGPSGWRATEPPTLTVVGARDLPRPALAFLADGGDVSPSEPPAAGPARYPPEGDQGSPAAVRTTLRGDARLRADHDVRRLARQRRRDTLGVLVLALVVSFMIGFLPGATVAWVATGVLTAVLAAYLVVLVHMRRVAEEREQKLRYLPRSRSEVPIGAAVTIDHGVDDPDADHRRVLAAR